MVPSQRFRPIHELAKNSEYRAAKEVGESQRALSEAESQLQELRRYRQEYMEQLNRAGAGGISGARLQDYQRFMSRLNEAIRQQEATVRANHQSLQSLRANWRDRRNRQAVLGKVVERCSAIESRQRERREQKLMDELTQSSGKPGGRFPDTK